MSKPAFKRSRSTSQRNIVEMAAKVEKMDMPELWFRKRKRVFKLLDPADTGLASREGQEVMAQRFEKYANMSPEDGKEMRNIMFSFFDDVMKNPNATMTFEQYCKVDYVLHTRPELKDDLDMFIANITANMFKIIDTNHDGIISRKEWRVFFKCMDVSDEKVADEAFDAIDLNKDGIMSEDEFIKGGREFILSTENGRYDLFYGPLPEL